MGENTELLLRNSNRIKLCSSSAVLINDRQDAGKDSQVFPAWSFGSFEGERRFWWNEWDPNDRDAFQVKYTETNDL